MRANTIIERVLRDHPETRSSDRELYINVWESYGFFMSDSQKAKFREMPSSETIRRVRQKIQQEGKYPADVKIRRHRHQLGQEVSQKMPQTKVEKVEPLLESIMPRAVEASKLQILKQTELI